MRTTFATCTLVAVLTIPGLMLGHRAPALAGQAPSVTDTRPESNLIVGSQYPQISAQFVPGSSPIDASSIRLTVDDADVTSVSTVTNTYVSYVPQNPMSSGPHIASVAGQAADGTSFSESWTFRVDAGASASDLSANMSAAPQYGSSSYGYPGYGYPGYGYPGYGYSGCGYPGYGYPGYGYPGYGYYPPGFSLFAPGPIFFVAGDFIQIVFFSPFCPYGDGFVTIGGIPGRFFLTPWAGCPGYFWARVPVPFGIFNRRAVLSAHFTTSGGRTVIVHSTTPLQIDGTRRALPGNVRYANEPVFLAHPASPTQMMKFERVGSSARLPAATAGSIPFVTRITSNAPAVTHPPNESIPNESTFNHVFSPGVTHNQQGASWPLYSNPHIPGNAWNASGTRPMTPTLPHAPYSIPSGSNRGQ